MILSLAQTFYIDKSQVQNADEIIITSVDLFIKKVPTATSNKSGITNPGITVALAPVDSQGNPDTTKFFTDLARVEYSSLNVDSTAATKTNFKFSKPIIVKTNTTYAFIVGFDGQDPDFSLWSAKEGDYLVGTKTIASGGFAKNVGNYYTYASGQMVPLQSNSLSTTGQLTSVAWNSVKDTDIKFTVYCGRFNVSANSIANNVYTSNSVFVKNRHEYIIFDPLNSYSMVGGRYLKYGGNDATKLWTAGYDPHHLSGEYIYQVTPLQSGTVSVKANTNVVTSSGFDFTTIFKGNGSLPQYIVLVSNSYMNTDSRSFYKRPKQKYYTGANYYDPFRSDTDVRKIVSVNSTALVLDNNPTFTDTAARFSVSPVATMHYIDYRHDRTVDWDDDFDFNNKSNKKQYSILHLKDSNANTSVKFVNNTIEYIMINIPKVSYVNQFAYANSAANNPLYAVAFGGGSFMAVGEKQTVQTSTDGKTWTKTYSNSSSNASLYGVAYGNSVYVAVGNNNTIMTSPNGSTWTKRTAPTGDGRYAFRGVTYGANSTSAVWVAVGRYNDFKTGGYIATSPDSVTWTQRYVANSAYSSLSGALRGVAYGNSGFVAVGDNYFAQSNDGVNWISSTRNTSGYSGQFFDVAYGNGVFVAVGTAGIQTTVNGTSWTSVSINSNNYGQYLFGVTYAPDTGAFVATGARGLKSDFYTLVSLDKGATWTLRDQQPKIRKYLDKQAGFRKVAWGNSASSGNLVVIPVLTRDRRYGSPVNDSYGQIVYANSSALTSVPGANVESSTGTNYASSDYIEVYCTNSSYTTLNAYANVVVSGGAITNVVISNTGYGFPADTSQISYKIYTSAGTGANLSFLVGSTLRSEHSGLVYSNTVVTNLEAHKIVPVLQFRAPKEIQTYKFKFRSPWFRDTDDVIKYGGMNYKGTNVPDVDDIVIDPTSNTAIETQKTRLIMSRSNELAYGVTSDNTGLVSNSSSNNDFSVLIGNNMMIYPGSYIINNDYSLENTKNGRALAKHITTKVNFAQGSSAEDLVIFIDAYRPPGTDVKVYAKIWNQNDSDAFDDKDWTLLTYDTNQTVYSVLGDLSTVNEYQFGFPTTPNTVFTSIGSVGVTQSNSTVTGTGTSFGLDYRPGDLVSISSPLFANVYQISVVNAIANDTSLTLTDNINVTSLGSPTGGLNISLLGRITPTTNNIGFSSTVAPGSFGYPLQVFNNINNGNVVRYYNSAMAPFDTYNSFQLKIVMLSSNVAIAPMIRDIRAIGVSA
jgi:hypothetical protein